MPFFLLIYTYTHKQGRNVMFHQRDLSVSASTSAVTSWFRSPYQNWESRALSSLSQVRSQYYCRNVLGDGILPEIRAICQHHTWTLQQDGAPSHTAKSTIWSICDGRTFFSLSLTCGSQTART